MNVIYSVTVAVEESIAHEWEAWMQAKHIPDVMATGCFLDYRLLKLLDPPSEPGLETFNVQYVCANRAALDDYLENFADLLRQDHAQRYAGKFVAFRTVLEKR
jgi:hypothetical protein